MTTAKELIERRSGSFMWIKELDDALYQAKDLKELENIGEQVGRTVVHSIDANQNVTSLMKPYQAFMKGLNSQLSKSGVVR